MGRSQAKPYQPQLSVGLGPWLLVQALKPNSAPKMAARTEAMLPLPPTNMVLTMRNISLHIS